MFSDVEYNHVNSRKSESIRDWVSRTTMVPLDKQSKWATVRIEDLEKREKSIRMQGVRDGVDVAMELIILSEKLGANTVLKAILDKGDKS